MQYFAENINNLEVPEAMAKSNNDYAIQANTNFNAIKGLAQTFTW